MVAQFRATHDLWAGDPAFRRPAGAFARRAAPNSQAGGKRTTSAAPRPDRKSLIHPKKGR